MADYNGWKNYETWAVALWIDNSEWSYRMRQDWTKACWTEAEATESEDPKKRATVLLMATIKRYVEGCNPLADKNSMYADLLGAAISEVDFYEIAENWIADWLEDRAHCDQCSATYDRKWIGTICSVCDGKIVAELIPCKECGAPHLTSCTCG